MVNNNPKRLMDDLYLIRMRRAAMLSVLLHALLFLPFAALERSGGPGPSPKAEPILLRLQAPDPAPPRQLVDVTQPAETPPEEDLNRIAEENSNARDSVLRDGEEAGPRLEEEDEFDTLAMRRPAAPPLPPPAPIPEPPAGETEETAEEETAKETPEPEEAEEEPDYIEEPSERTLRPPETTQAPKPVEAVEAEERPEEDASVVPLQLAQAEVPGQAEFGGRTSKGRFRDAVRHKGFTNFEAIGDQVAPYLKKIKLRVERRWNEALLHRYSGLTPTEAVIECAIAPDGTVVSAKITGGPRDPIYAALCRKAVFDAGPFGPFPFEVPDVYRNQNLEIRWTFSFL